MTEPINDETPQRPVGNVRSTWSFSADSIRENTTHMSADEQESLLALFRWCIDPQHPLRLEDTAKRLKCSTALIYQLLTGKYREPVSKAPKRPSDEFMTNLRDFLALEAKRFELGKTDFVLTPTAKRIERACNLARESQTPVFIWGPSHIGKTWAVTRHYLPENNHGKTLYCRMQAAAGLGGMVRAMAKAAGVADKSNNAELIQRIKNATTPNTLWILDELHLLAHTYRKGSFHNSMELLREIYDETDCGLAMMFTILDELKAASQKELQQLWRRGIHKVPLPLMPTKGDLAAILGHYGFDGEVYSEGKKEIGVFPSPSLEVTVKNITEKPYDILRQVSKNDGLKAITERIRYAQKLAGKADGKISWHHFVDAHLRIAKQAEQDGEWD
jgi:hypothetical protein